MRRKAFTLIELLVVIAIIAVLMGILMPSLRLARDHAKRIHCVSNVKTLALGWYMYKDDNDAKIMGGTSWEINETGGKKTPPWVGGQGGDWEQQKQDIRDGALYKYVGETVDIYRCPSDRRTESSSNPAPAFRTFSIPGGANGEIWSSYDPIKLYTELKNPAIRYIFVEEMDTRGSNLGSWQMHPRKSNPSWTDPVAMWHNKKSTLGFADGHAEMHAWQDKSFIDWNLKAMYGEPGFDFDMTPPTEDFQDIEYMAKGFPYKRLK